MKPSPEKFKIVWFENEMLPKWAQLLDVATQLCHVSENTRGWFSRFTNSAGVDDSRTIVNECQLLLMAIKQEKDVLIRELERTRGDGQAPQIVAAWEYALDTMIHEARSKKTCSWRIEGVEDKGGSDHGDGDITLRRV
jgi:hypothetical protein